MGNIGFMSKLVNKTDHKLCHSLAKEIFGGDMLDVALPRLDGFERCGESFDTVISANPATYIGSSEALKMPKLRLRILLKLYLIVSNLSVQIEVAMNTKRKRLEEHLMALRSAQMMKEQLLIRGLHYHQENSCIQLRACFS